ncbi:MULTISPECIES: hypothetical protein [unclassified Roseateles]|uniref:hypothetical protein n=1 Tax=unclassified Roseateles TaxID=2626991 RepID=UPI0006F576FD|nr:MULTISPECIES: hypothetical protein [unclassified Roseateles]KQW45788.1 hypothetical protein ASC81_12945 [Pelomonas sp. Root405]KRA72632.1 hypothetical protein ASD88_12945 [Pelomonas sp. Root662]
MKTTHGSRRRLLLAGLAGMGSLGGARAEAPAMHVPVDGSIEMPQAQFKDGRPVDGLQFHLALATTPSSAASGSTTCSAAARHRASCTRRSSSRACGRPAHCHRAAA